MMLMKRKILERLALEEKVETSEKMETEVIVYAKIDNFEGLHGADNTEEQFQLQGEFSNGIRCRVRRVTIDEQAKYYFTYKLPTQNKEGLEANIEHTAEVDKDFFDGFKSVAKTAVNKTRYKFDSRSVTMTINVDGEDKVIVLPNIQYEVDVYRDRNGEYIDWCKIDVEVDVILNFIKSNYPEYESMRLSVKTNHLPFQPVTPIMAQSANEEQRAFIDSLWDEKFNLNVET